jgi:hypothetical protein
MNCRDFKKLVLALARDSLLDATTREQGLGHTEVCARCAARLAEERALLADLRAVAAELAGEEPPARVDAALLAAFRAKKVAMASQTVISMPSRTSHWWSWKLAAVAAGIMILLSLIAIFWRSTGSFRPQQENQAVLPTPDPRTTPPKQAKPPISRDQAVTRQPEKGRKRVHRRASRDDSAEVEVVTQFFQLREGEDITTLESLQLVRIELPGSALSEIGLPVSIETANSPVEADVLLGQDGMARAIRFVH